jgi:hypothetical protein
MQTLTPQEEGACVGTEMSGGQPLPICRTSNLNPPGIMRRIAREGETQKMPAANSMECECSGRTPFKAGEFFSAQAFKLLADVWGTIEFSVAIPNQKNSPIIDQIIFHPAVFSWQRILNDQHELCLLHILDVAIFIKLGESSANLRVRIVVSRGFHLEQIIHSIATGGYLPCRASSPPMAAAMSLSVCVCHRLALRFIQNGKFLFPKLCCSFSKLHANHRVVWKRLAAAAGILEVEN